MDQAFEAVLAMSAFAVVISIVYFASASIYAASINAQLAPSLDSAASIIASTIIMQNGNSSLAWRSWTPSADPDDYVAPAGLVGRWKFDEGSGTVAQDSSGMGNNGNISGASWVNGISGKALSFDGVDDRASLTSPLQSPTTELTVSAWVYIRSINRGTPEYDRGTAFVSDWNTWNPGNQKGFILRIFHSNLSDRTCWTFNIADGTNYYSVDYESLPASEFVSRYCNKWIHYVGVFKGGEYIDLYLNGTRVIRNTWSVPSQMVPETTTPTFVAWSGINSAYTNATIDEIRIYNRALSADEIQAIYRNTRPSTIYINATCFTIDPSGQAVTLWSTATPTAVAAAAGTADRFVVLDDGTALKLEVRVR